MARKHPWALNLRVGLYSMNIRLFCAFQNHKSMRQSSPFLTPWFLWEIFLHSLTCSLWKLIWACSSIVELVSICNKIRNKNTGKKTERKARCQHSTTRIMRFFSSAGLQSLCHKSKAVNISWLTLMKRLENGIHNLVKNQSLSPEIACYKWLWVHFQHNLQ